MEQERALVWQAGCSALESGRGESEAGKGIIGEEKEKRGGTCCWSGPPRGSAAAGLKRAGLGIGFGLLDSSARVSFPGRAPH